MIVRINVNDNDFASSICEKLASQVDGLTFITDSLFNDLLFRLRDKNDAQSLKDYRDIAETRDEIREFFAYGDEGRKEFNLEEIKKYVKEAILNMIKDKYSEEDMLYLEDSIEISFPKSMNCKWENAEVIYYIPNTYSENHFLLF